MRTEIRFLLAVGLMMVVLVGTNILFPPIIPDDPQPGPGGDDPALVETPRTTPEPPPSLTDDLPGAVPPETDAGADAD